MTPKIDYVLLGLAVEEYQYRGYLYKEVPWTVNEEAIRATLPEPHRSLQLAMKPESDLAREPLLIYNSDSHLVGSAEQGFLQMDLPLGKYVGVTPCFRHEPKLDIFYQTAFMKVELFVNQKDVTVDQVLSDAREVMALIGGILPDVVSTSEGFDLEIADIEVGSYGSRSHAKFGDWIYGTGLALPRFSVARAFHSVV